MRRTKQKQSIRTPKQNGNIYSTSSPCGFVCVPDVDKSVQTNIKESDIAAKYCSCVETACNTPWYINGKTVQAEIQIPSYQENMFTYCDNCYEELSQQPNGQTSTLWTSIENDPEITFHGTLSKKQNGNSSQRIIPPPTNSRYPPPLQAQIFLKSSITSLKNSATQAGKF